MPARAGPGTGGGLAHKTQRKINVLDLDVSAVRVAEIERDVQRAWSAVHEHLKGGEGVPGNPTCEIDLARTPRPYSLLKEVVVLLLASAEIASRAPGTYAQLLRKDTVPIQEWRGNSAAVAGLARLYTTYEENFARLRHEHGIDLQKIYPFYVGKPMTTLEGMIYAR